MKGLLSAAGGWTSMPCRVWGPGCPLLCWVYQEVREKPFPMLVLLLVILLPEDTGRCLRTFEGCWCQVGGSQDAAHTPQRKDSRHRE